MASGGFRFDSCTAHADNVRPLKTTHEPIDAMTQTFNNTRRSIIFALTLAAACLAPSASRADDLASERAGHWEIGLPGKYWMGSDAIESALGTGFMIGYNLDAHWNVNLEGYIGIRLDTEVDGVEGKGSIYTAMINLEYILKPGRFSPYLSVCGGVFNYDAKETFDGPSAFNVAETGVSYGGGAGVRWELSRHWFVKGAYRALGTSADGACLLHGPEITIGWLF
jgi:opacity protein-like surface antigen